MAQVGAAIAQGVTLDRIGCEQLGLAVIQGQRPEGIHRRQLPGREMQAIDMAAVQYLALHIVQRHRVHRFHGIVGVDVAPGHCRPGQVVVTEFADVGR
ncbi:hypothetical protein D3C81_1707180 [compost metagenome]